MILTSGCAAFHDERPDDESVARLEASLQILVDSGDDKVNATLQMIQEYRCSSMDVIVRRCLS